MYKDEHIKNTGKKPIESIFDKKMKDPKFRRVFQAEYLKLTISEATAELRQKKKVVSTKTTAKS